MPVISEWINYLNTRRASGKAKRQAHDRSWYQAIGGAMLCGIIAMVIFATSLKMFACAFLIGIAATLVGAFAGFVFGIPKSITSQNGTNDERELFKTNTNLEEISDWLTKILVGAGLVELGKIASALRSFGDSFAGKDTPLGPSGWIIAPALVITYSVCGFLLAYLWARIYMLDELERIATEAMNRKIEAAQISLNQLPPRTVNTPEVGGGQQGGGTQ
jgi:hypothetical protein